MITLALDAATDTLSLAVGREAGDAWEAHVAGARRHAGALLPILETLLRQAVAEPDQISRVVVADGPGSFTGLRVAAAVAKALVQAGAATLHVTPSLLGRAWRAAQGEPGLILACSSALRGEVFAGWYRITPGAVTIERTAMTLRPEEVRDGPVPDLVAGDAPDEILLSLGRHWGVPVRSREASTSDARALLALLGLAGATRIIEDAAAWEPVYGRPAEAQARWEREHGRPLPDSSSAV